jgi:hypothetical protein
VITTEIVNVTPDMAEAWLTKAREHDGPVNRPLSTQRVGLLAAAMRRGEWRLTHQGIAFNPEGFLIDGQHRLQAVVNCGRTVPIAVSRGDIDFHVLDIGKVRTTHDILSLSGFRNTTTTNGMARMLMAYESGQSRPWKMLRQSYSTIQVTEFLIKHDEEMQPWATIGDRIAKRLGGPGRAAYAAALYTLWRWTGDVEVASSTIARNGTRMPYARDELQDFTDGLISGAGLPPGDPRLALASWANGASRLISDHQRKAEILFVMTLRAFIQFLSGETMRSMIVRDANTYNYVLPLVARS